MKWREVPMLKLEFSRLTFPLKKGFHCSSLFPFPGLMVAWRCRKSTVQGVQGAGF